MTGSTPSGRGITMKLPPPRCSHSTFRPARCTCPVTVFIRCEHVEQWEQAILAISIATLSPRTSTCLVRLQFPTWTVITVSATMVSFICCLLVVGLLKNSCFALLSSSGKTLILRQVWVLKNSLLAVKFQFLALLFARGADENVLGWIFVCGYFLESCRICR